MQKKDRLALYRDLRNGYRWRLRAPPGETLAATPQGHTEKASCEAELRAAMADHPSTELLDATVTNEAG